MRSHYLLTFGILPLLLTVGCSQIDKRVRYEAALKEHPYYQERQGDYEGVAKHSMPDLALHQDFLLTMDPKLGRPAQERLENLMMAFSMNERTDGTVPGDEQNPWTELGPTNVGGRTRAIMFDPNDNSHRKVWAGGVTGGLWYNDDITNSTSKWVNVGDFWDNTAITCMAYDPADIETFYVGTGEGWYQSVSGAPGAGVWKTTDAGKTWSQLPNTSDFHYVHDLVVREENGTGVLYVSTDYSTQRFLNKQSPAIAGVYKSTDGGASFKRQTLDGNLGFRAADLEIGPDNRLWVGTYLNFGSIIYTDDGTTWVKSVEFDDEERVELAVAPSNADYVYALISKNRNCEKILVTKNGGDEWIELNQPEDANHSNQNWSRNQAGYDLIAQVDPNDENTVYIGTINWFKSANAGNTWNQLTAWKGSAYPEIHADQHQMIFRPTSNNSQSSREALIGNDGGLYLCSNLGASSPSFRHAVNRYNTTQFYACAIHPDPSVNYFLAGSQDNGTHQFTSNQLSASNEVTGGDGGFCYIDSTNPSVQISSYIYNYYWVSTNNGGNFRKLGGNESTGWFINPTGYDHNLNILFGSKSDNALYRVNNIGSSNSVDQLSISLGSRATHLKISPYTSGSTTLFVGTAAGRLFKVENANTSSPIITEIGGATLPNGSISCVDLGANEDEILLTYYNYGITSVWYSSNGGKNWKSKEGDLPDLPVRWCLFNPSDRENVILATELGVWSTSNFKDNSPIWGPSSKGLANVRVDQLRLRSRDLTVLAATHGRGLFISDGFLHSAPNVVKQPIDITTCPGTSQKMSIKATGKKPLEFQWFKDGNIVNDATSNQLTLSKLGSNDEGYYYCRVSNPDGVAWSDSSTLTLFPNPKPDLGADMEIRPDVTVILSTPNDYRTYIWSEGDNTPTLKLKGSDLEMGANEITLSTYTDDLCESADTLIITVNDQASIKETNPAALEVFPNPVSDILNVKTSGSSINGLKLLSSNGQVIMNLPDQGSFHVESLPSGTYYLEANSSSGRIVKKILKN